MITKFRVHEDSAVREFGMACQRIVPWSGQEGEPPFGAMACFLPAGAASAPDCHDQDEVMVILSGSGSIDLAGEKDEFAVGDVLVLPLNHEHVVHNPGPETLTWLSMYWPLHEPRQGLEPPAPEATA